MTQQPTTVIDFHAARADRLATEQRSMEEQLGALLKAGKSNTVQLYRAQNAVFDLLDCQSLSDLLTCITTRLPVHMKTEFASLCLESPRGRLFPQKQSGVYWLTRGSVENLLGSSDFAMRPNVDAEARIFGPHTFKVESAAIARISLPRMDTIGVLGFGSARAGTWDEEDGTEVLNFLARVVERCLQNWMMLDAIAQDRQLSA